MPHISNQTYAKISLNIKGCQIIRIEQLVRAQRPFSHEHHKNYISIYIFTKINIIDVAAKFAMEWQPLIGVNPLTRAPNTTQKHDHFPV